MSIDNLTVHGNSGLFLTQTDQGIALKISYSCGLLPKGAKFEGCWPLCIFPQVSAQDIKSTDRPARQETQRSTKRGRISGLKSVRPLCYYFTLPRYLSNQSSVSRSSGVGPRQAIDSNRKMPEEGTNSWRYWRKTGTKWRV